MARSLKERQREERAALILEAASAILVEKGYHEMSIDEIAAQVGISKGTVYLHFASKEDLVATLIERQVIEFLALVDQVISEPSTVRARLEGILQQTYSAIQMNRQLLPGLTNSIRLTEGLIEKREGLQMRVAEMTARITSLFEEGKRTGELESTLPTPIIVTTFVGLLSLPGYEQQLTSGQVSPSELAASVSQLFFRGVLAPSPTTTKKETS